MIVVLHIVVSIVIFYSSNTFFLSTSNFNFLMLLSVIIHLARLLQYYSLWAKLACWLIFREILLRSCMTRHIQNSYLFSNTTKTRMRQNVNSAHTLIKADYYHTCLGYTIVMVIIGSFYTIF